METKASRASESAMKKLLDRLQALKKE